MVKLNNNLDSYLLESFSDIILILVPGVYKLYFLGFLSDIKSIILLSNLKYCNKTFPFVEAPYPCITLLKDFAFFKTKFNFFFCNIYLIEKINIRFFL